MVVERRDDGLSLSQELARLLWSGVPKVLSRTSRRTVHTADHAASPVPRRSLALRTVLRSGNLVRAVSVDCGTSPSVMKRAEFTKNLSPSTDQNVTAGD